MKPLQPTELEAHSDFTLIRRAARGPGGVSAWLAIPRRLDPTQPPLIAVHGIRRGARSQALAFALEAARQGRVVIAPRFSTRRYRGYQQVVLPQRADLALIALLADISAEGLCDTSTIVLFGYSGGAQFAHRFALIHPQRVAQLTVLAAGWYSFPDARPYPYGLAAPRRREGTWPHDLSQRLRAFLTLPIQVCVGEFDRTPDAHTRSAPRLDRQQGTHRLERSQRWVAALNAAAEANNLEPCVDFRILPGCHHDFSECVQIGQIHRIVLDPAMTTHRREPDRPNARGDTSGHSNQAPITEPFPLVPSPRPTLTQEQTTNMINTDATITSSAPELLATAKWAFSTRHVARTDATQLVRSVEQATSGDLMLARVTRIGSHQRLQLPEGRPSTLHVGDLIVAACGARYAADQFEGMAKIDPKGADLLAGGGCVGTLLTRNSRMRPPTRLLPLGLLADQQGQVINLDRYALPPRQQPSQQLNQVCVIGVVGAGMNSGKTTAAAALIRGLRLAGLRVGAIKATGTGAFGDYNAYVDAGARWVGDFTSAGMVSTYQQPIDRLEQALSTLISAAQDATCEFIVVELADGVLQQETAALLTRDSVRERFHGFLYAVPDALAALGGQIALSTLGIVPLALTGLISSAPLSVGEAARATGLPILSPEELSDPEVAAGLIETHGGKRPSWQPQADTVGLAA